MRQILRLLPHKAWAQLASDLVSVGICPACNVRLVTRWMENERLDRPPRYGQCPCCGWWWRSGDDLQLETLGQDSRCEHVSAVWEPGPAPGSFVVS